MYNKKRNGLTLIEIVVSITLVMTLTTVLNPILNFFLKLSSKHNYGINSTADVNLGMNVLEKQILKSSLSNSITTISNAKSNMGLIVGNINGETPTMDSSLLMTLNIADGSNENSKINFPNPNSNAIGNSLFIISPTVYSNLKNLNDNYNNKLTIPTFSLFRFVTSQDPTTNQWSTVLTYTTSYDSSDYTNNYVAGLTNKNQSIAWINEVQILPPTVSSIKLVPNHSSNNSNISEVTYSHSIPSKSGTIEMSNLNYFQAIPGGVKIHVTYYPNPSNLNIKAVEERIFLRKGEI